MDTNWILGLLSAGILAGIVGIAKNALQTAQLWQWKDEHEKAERQWKEDHEKAMNIRLDGHVAFMKFRMDAIDSQLADMKKMLILALSSGRKSAKIITEELIDSAS